VDHSLDKLLSLLTASRVYDLEQPRFQGAPLAASHAPGFVYLLHRRHEPDTGSARTSAAGMMITSEHAGTHIDALCHQAVNMRLFGDSGIDSRVQTSAGFTKFGADTIPVMLGRGVLLDVAAHAGVERLPDGQTISAAELQEVAEAQKTAIGEGDVVLVRTGNGVMWDNPDAYLRGAGMAADASRWLADLRVLAVGADNVAWDVPEVIDPQMQMTLPGHAILLVQNGIYILEHMYFEELSRDRVLDFVFVCLPLKLRGVTASPVRPIALSVRAPVRNF
jgi:kynurenine formamidase